VTADLGAAIAAALRSIEALYDLALSPGKATTESQIRIPYASKPPVSVTAVDVRGDALGVVGSWARLVAEECHLHPMIDGNDIHQVVGWLVPHAYWLADHDAGAEAADELAAVARGLRRHVDRRADDRELVGTCEVCGGDILAHPGAAQGHCRRCEVVVDAVAGRERIREELAVRLFTLRELRTAVTFYGWQLSHDRAESWVRRGRLQPHGMSAKGATYRLDEVLGLLSGEASKRAG
jgi:hypothetical protein